MYIGVLYNWDPTSSKHGVLLKTIGPCKETPVSATKLVLFMQQNWDISRSHSGDEVQCKKELE